MKHIISVDNIDHEFLHGLFDRATFIKRLRRNENNNYHWSNLCTILRGRLLITDFFEPSTRTRLSFESAMSYLGGSVIGTENAAEFSSFKKGESLEDNFKVLSSYCDIIVGRFLNEGDAQRASLACDVPLINGGDGKGEHPTQAMLDLFSIMEKFDHPDLTITFIGDAARSRTVRSLALLLADFGVEKINFISPEALMPEQAFLTKVEYTAGAPIIGNVVNHIRPDDIAASHVIYVTRSQNERGGEADHGLVFKGTYLNHMRDDAIILHPLPRNSELPSCIDIDPRAYYFEQARNGLYIRMALLETLCDRSRF